MKVCKVFEIFTKKSLYNNFYTRSSNYSHQICRRETNLIQHIYLDAQYVDVGVEFKHELRLVSSALFNLLLRSERTPRFCYMFN